MPDFARVFDFHRFLLSDSGRTSRYWDAISRVVGDDDVVVDIGAGTGILSLFACMAGARKVYAVEMTDSIELAREICSRNGFGGRIEFLKERSQVVTLPEAVDVIISDTGDTFGLQAGILGTLLDARQRFLRPGGRIIPRSLHLFVAPVNLPHPRLNLEIWGKDQYGVDLSSVRRFATNNNYHDKLGADNVVGSTELLATIDFEKFSSPYVTGRTRCVASRDAVMHGICGWVAIDLTQDISFTNSPVEPSVGWSQSIFPVETPVELKSGDCVNIKISTNNGQEWRWQVEVTAEGTTPSGPARIKARYDQATMWSFPSPPGQFLMHSPEYKPTLSRRASAELHLLSSLDGKRTMSDLESELFLQYGDCFPTVEAASEFVLRTILRHS